MADQTPGSPQAVQRWTAVDSDCGDLCLDVERWSQQVGPTCRRASQSPGDGKRAQHTDDALSNRTLEPVSFLLTYVTPIRVTIKNL